MTLTRRIVTSTISGLRGYKLEKELNCGHYARVYQALHIETNTYWACKVIEKKKLRQSELERVRQEVLLILFYTFNFN